MTLLTLVQVSHVNLREKGDAPKTANSAAQTTPIALMTKIYVTVKNTAIYPQRLAFQKTLPLKGRFALPKEKKERSVFKGPAKKAAAVMDT
jgi:hypothetical protein